MSMEIIEFQPDFAAAFRAINEAWISQLFALEPQDIAALSDPYKYYIAPGGEVLFVGERNGNGQSGAPKLVGCVALKKMSDGGFEIAKMGVLEQYKGQGLGRMLIQACIDRARARGAHRVYLETNSSLTPAVSLYRSLGFEEIKGAVRGTTDYERVNLWMELKL